MFVVQHRDDVASGGIDQCRSGDCGALAPIQIGIVFDADVELGLGFTRQDRDGVGHGCFRCIVGHQVHNQVRDRHYGHSHHARNHAVAFGDRLRQTDVECFE